VAFCPKIKISEIMKKTSPIVFWDFEIDKEKRVAYRRE